MKILIVGASGLVGWNCFQIAQKEGHEVLGTYHQTPQPGMVALALHSQAEIERTLQGFQPDAVVCCAAWSWVDGCQGDPQRAFAHNAEEPARLAEAAERSGAKFVHFSTSYVFDGTQGPYGEEDAPCPISIYGESKLAGEIAVLKATEGRAVIARTMGVYGVEPQRKNFVYQVVRNLSEGKRMKIPLDQCGNATYAPDLAYGVLRLLERNERGIWNLAGPNPNLCRKDFALLIAKEYGLDASLFDFLTTAELGQPAQRPLHGGLQINKAVTHLQLTVNDWNPIAL